MFRVNQYDNPIPDELLILEFCAVVEPADITTVMQARWYLVPGRRYDHIILVPVEDMVSVNQDDLVDPTPTDLGITSKMPLLSVAQSLKRYNDMDGFYTV